MTPTPKPTRAAVLAMTAHERDAAVAEHVMGLSVGPPLEPAPVKVVACGPNAAFKVDGIPADFVPRYSTTASADYAVLDRVREAWAGQPGFGRFMVELQCLWRQRWTHEPPDYRPLFYQPGDYALAALLALTED